MAQSIITNNSLRLYLMDRPQNNTLIDGVRWSEEMINEAVLNTIDAFNIIPPPANNFFSVETFPSRYLLLTGVAGYLLKSASINESSNNLTYSADSVQINDKDKGPIFAQLGKQYWDEFKEIATAWKVSNNLAQTYGNHSSEFITRLFT